MCPPTRRPCNARTSLCPFLLVESLSTSRYQHLPLRRLHALRRRPLFHCVFGRLMFLCFASRRCAHVFVGSYPGMHEQLPRHCRCLWDLLPCVRELLDRNYRVLPGSLRRQPQHRNVQPCRRMLGPRRAIFVHHGRHWRLHYDGRLL